MFDVVFKFEVIVKYCYNICVCLENEEISIIEYLLDLVINVK